MYHEISRLTPAESCACLGALKDWNQSHVLMHNTGVIQVKTLTNGLVLPTAAFVFASGRSWVGWKHHLFTVFAHSGIGNFAESELQKLSELSWCKCTLTRKQMKASWQCLRKIRSRWVSEVLLILGPLLDFVPLLFLFGVADHINLLHRLPYLTQNCVPCNLCQKCV